MKLNQGISLPIQTKLSFCFCFFFFHSIRLHYIQLHPTRSLRLSPFSLLFVSFPILNPRLLQGAACLCCRWSALLTGGWGGVESNYFHFPFLFPPSLFHPPSSVDRQSVSQTEHYFIQKRNFSRRGLSGWLRLLFPWS